MDSARPLAPSLSPFFSQVNRPCERLKSSHQGVTSQQSTYPSPSQRQNTMAASTLTSEQLQLLVLEQLDSDAGSIPDTRSMKLADGTTAVGGAHNEQMAIKGALDALSAKEMVSYTQQQIDSLVLTPEGEVMAQDGSHEFRVWNALDPAQETSAKALQEKLGKELATVGQLNAFKKKWIRKQGDGFVRAVSGGCTRSRLS